MLIRTPGSCCHVALSCGPQVGVRRAARPGQAGRAPDPGEISIPTIRRPRPSCSSAARVSGLPLTITAPRRPAPHVQPMLSNSASAPRPPMPRASSRSRNGVRHERRVDEARSWSAGSAPHQKEDVAGPRYAASTATMTSDREPPGLEWRMPSSLVRRCGRPPGSGRRARRDRPPRSGRYRRWRPSGSRPGPGPGVNPGSALRAGLTSWCTGPARSAPTMAASRTKMLSGRRRVGRQEVISARFPQDRRNSSCSAMRGPCRGARCSERPPWPSIAG